MLTNFFGKSKPINTIIIIGFFVTAYLLSVLKGRVIFQWEAFPLALVMFGAVNFIDIKNDLTLSNSYMFLFFVLLMCFFYETTTINSVFYENLMLFFFFRRVYSLQSYKKMYQKLFDAGLVLGFIFSLNSTSAAFNPYVIVFALFLYLAIFFYNRVSVRTLLIPAIGFVVPLFLHFTYCFLTDTVDAFYDVFRWDFNSNFSIYSQPKFLFPIVFTLFFTMIAFFVKTLKVIVTKSSFQSTWHLIITHFVLAVMVIVLTKNKTGSEFLYILFPMALILANGLELYRKKRIANIGLILFVICAFAFLFYVKS